MFNIDSSEFLLVALVALVVIGPKDLPKAMRVVGYWVGRARAVGRQFRAGFDEMVREAELEEMEKKWKAENERIMREHPMIPPPPSEPASGDHTPSDASLAPSHDHAQEEHPPVMVEQPRVVPGGPHETPPADSKAPS
ncbi:Sec-independent protein translocase protein TatB [Sphingomonas sp. RRHST34]|uniref:Sec-independent protein translocase protein TatB n=1 Tax=Sphingomonas citri TaxID=2862499 RepID=A0ABS7BM44_9SPHN|nr:Sec-independent protein translocase protein TatB [Sphingomonas citri]MBW6530684.1 Sec-independent protein translocase protein TatB [Sphingomonas citri]